MTALAQVLLGLIAIYPEVFGMRRLPLQSIALDWVGRGVTVFGCSALATFLFVVYREAESLNSSARMPLAALIAAISLSMENLLPTYGTIRGVIFSSRDLLAWKYHPLKHISYVLAPTIPTIAVVSLIVFLIVVYRSSLGASVQSTQLGAGDCRHRGLRNAALLALSASVLAGGELLYFVAANPIAQARRFAVGLRLLSLVSLGLFFLLVRAAQTPGES